MKIKSYYICLKYRYLHQSLLTLQAILVKNFIEGRYKGSDDAEATTAFEINRINKSVDLYEVTQKQDDHKQSWKGFYEYSSRQLCDLQRTRFMTFLPEQKKMIFDGKEFIKQN